MKVDEIFGEIGTSDVYVLIKELFEHSKDKVEMFQTLYNDCLSDEEKQSFIDYNIDAASVDARLFIY